MNIVINLLSFVGAYLFMEFMAWFTHKYVMHGLLWHLHKDHHLKDHDGFFEKNDYFFLIFATPSCLCMFIGVSYGYPALLCFGLGILAYGLTYFFVHDIFVHQRFRFLRLTNSRYLKALRRAHKMHHKHLGKHPGESYGMLLFPKKYWNQKPDPNDLLGNQ